MKDLNTLIKKYERQQKQYINTKEELENKIQELEILLNENDNKRPHYIDNILLPLTKELMKKLNLKYYSVYGPFGLNAETSIYMSNERKGKSKRNIYKNESDIDICNCETWSLTVRPDFTYDTGKKTNTYAKGSIGDLNGENKIFDPLPNDIEDIINCLHHSNR